jgi:hypothetical protein
LDHHVDDVNGVRVGPAGCGYRVGERNDVIELVPGKGFPNLTLVHRFGSYTNGCIRNGLNPSIRRVAVRSRMRPLFFTSSHLAQRTERRMIVTIVRVGLAETKKFADGYEAIFGKKSQSTRNSKAQTKKPKPAKKKGRNHGTKAKKK